jgi:hypothetical protein
VKCILLEARQRERERERQRDTERERERERPSFEAHPNLLHPCAIVHGSAETLLTMHLIYYVYILNDGEQPKHDKIID